MSEKKELSVLDNVPAKPVQLVQVHITVGEIGEDGQLGHVAAEAAQNIEINNGEVDLIAVTEYAYNTACDLNLQMQMNPSDKTQAHINARRAAFATKH